MGEKWEDCGSYDIMDDLMFGLGGRTHTVRNKETWEYRKVHVSHGQDVGDAIKNGQFIDEDD